MMDQNKKFPRKPRWSATGLLWVLLSSCGQVAGLNNKAKLATATDAPLALIAISPASGPVTGGTVISLIGTGFRSGTSVSIDGVDCAGLQVVSSTLVRCTTASHLFGATTVVLLSPLPNGGSGAASLTNGYTYLAASRDLAGYAITAGGGIATGNGILMRASVGEIGAVKQIGNTGENIQSRAGVSGVFYKRSN